MNTSISIYENAKHWIAQYESVDEVKEYIDKAAAVEEYARRANDYEIEHQAARARVRAERRCGELLKDMEKNTGRLKRGTELPQSNGSTTATLSDMGLSKNQSSKWQQLANVPEDDFEDALKIEGAIPSAHRILKSRQPQPEPKRIDVDCLYLWGELIRFEKQLFQRDLNELLDEMTPAMRKDADRILPIFKTWLER